MTKNLKINTDRLLPWENLEEYETFVVALIEEHAPEGPTERHLVDELAGIIWRLQRVGMAEAALHRHGLSQAREPFKDTVKHAFAYVGGSEGDASVSNALTTTTEDRNEELLNNQDISVNIEKALRIAETGKYEPALKVLLPDTAEWWSDILEEGEDGKGYDREATSESLAGWLRFEVLTWLQSAKRTLVHQDDIRNQAFGASLDPVKFNELGKWEAHLDRKLERTLTMLVRLKELRSAA
jgi:hypothetical protein